MKVSLDLIMTTGVAALVVFLGTYLVQKIRLLRAFCIPAPVVSGLLVSIILCLFKVNGILTVKWTPTLGPWAMNMFLTAVGFGFTSDLLKKGGKLCGKIALTAVIVITLQDVVGVVLAKAMSVHPLIGLSCGSLAMYGGVGTAAAFGPVFEKLGLEGATAIGVAAGTFGMVVASLCGGPSARFLIRKFNLQPTQEDGIITQTEEKIHKLDAKRMANAFFLLLCMGGAGGPIHALLKMIPNVKVPYFLGCLIAGLITRNTMEHFHKDCYEKEMDVLEHMILYLFIAITIMTLDLTKLVAVAGAMTIILIGEVVITVLAALVIAFPIYGKSYNSAVMVAGLIGTGLGATPNAVANEKAVMDEFGWANLAWVLFPGMSVLAGNIYNPLLVTVVQKFVASL